MLLLGYIHCIPNYIYSILLSFNLFVIYLPVDVADNVMESLVENCIDVFVCRSHAAVHLLNGLEL